MKKSFVYILLCNDDSYYTGVTNDIDRRLQEHNHSDNDSYTSKRRPLTLVYSQEFNDIKASYSIRKANKRLD